VPADGIKPATAAIAGLPKERRIYIGNLPDNCDTENLKQFCKLITIIHVSV
jgi:hypothetical protein